MLKTDLRGKVVIITGVASGIGEAQALTFLNEGALVCGVDIASFENLSPLLQQSETFLFVEGDISLSETAEKAVGLTVDKWDGIDILLNTAGILDDFTPTLETSEEKWDRMMAINVKGMYLMTNMALPFLLASENKGVIVNMTSIAGTVGGGGGAAYTASKHAVVGYTKQLTYDYAKQGLRANAIAPGAIKTPMNAADFEGDAVMAKWVAEETPAGRWAEAHEVANLSLFLASSLADYIHGAVIPIDGGWTAK